uniref:ER membrane protein complex subunit 2 n=1 Tax=Hucho hucho TaxID=62062 RepID=A0A4W5LWZ4_9TELE
MGHVKEINVLIIVFTEMRDKLRKWREDNHRNSEQIVDVGEELINEHASKLGDDIWIIYEQVMIAALDCSRDDLAWCLQKVFTPLDFLHILLLQGGIKMYLIVMFCQRSTQSNL